MSMPIPRDPVRPPIGGRPPIANGKNQGGKNNNKQGNNKPNHPKYVGGFAGYKGVKYHDAAQIVNPQIRNQLNDIRDQKDQIRSDTRDQTQSANSDYIKSQGDINALFGASGNMIAGFNQQAAQGYADAATKQAAAQQALAQQLTQNGQQNFAGANDELARLGIQGSMDTGRFMADQAYAQNTAAINGQNASDNLALESKGSAALGNMLMGMNQASQASHLGQALNTRNDALQEIQNNKLDSMRDMNKALQEAKSTRPELINNLLNQLSQTGWAQYVDNKNLSIQQQQMNLQRRAQAFSEQQARRAAGFSSGGGSSSGGSSSGGSYGSNRAGTTGSVSGGGAPIGANGAVSDYFLNSMGHVKHRGGKKKK